MLRHLLPHALACAQAAPLACASPPGTVSVSGVVGDPQTGQLRQGVGPAGVLLVQAVRERSEDFRCAS